uniref:Uncharacterized protein n=1 Tax=Streptomyces sp. NBC_00049 TaxID=2903617 RepID=A0AAU2JXZ8_9ACTN
MKKIFLYGREKEPIAGNWFNSHAWKVALAAIGLMKPLDPEKPGLRCEESRNKGMHALP